MRRIFQNLSLTLILIGFFDINAQVVVNEASNRNTTQVADEDSEFNDWIELYNPSASAVNLVNFALSDDTANVEKWKFPDYQMMPGEHQIIFASGKDRVPGDAFHWESPVLPEHTFQYIIPASTTPANWNQQGFVPAGWISGSAGFGYGDGDDMSIVPESTLVVYILKHFDLPVGFTFKDAALHVDYDDGFVAYLNGTKIAGANISGTPSWNSAASANREALMITGGKPENFPLDTILIKSLLKTGENVFAIEVHNTAASSSDLSLIPFFSLRISDSYNLFDKTPSWLIASTSSKFHTNFKIDSNGEEILLYNRLTGEKEKVWVGGLSAGWSTGRVTDGSASWGIFIEPTPGSANNTTAYTQGREPDPVFSIPEGYYTSTQAISLSSPSPTSVIRYTTDGSEPTQTSMLYTGTPINAVITRVIRATCFSTSNKLPGRSVGNTYFIRNTGHSVPVLSIVTANTNLYGSSGIFDNWNQEWEKPCYVEYFDANGIKKFEQASGIQIDGGAGGSRSNPQHSFRLEFNNNVFGDGKLKYNLISDRPNRINYKSVYLRNGSNQWITFMFKDAMETKMMSYKTKNYYSACKPTVVYINGTYFGLYEMREKLNDEFFEENYNANVDSAFHLLSLSYYYGSVLRALNGSVDSFTSDYNDFIDLNKTAPDYLQKAGKILDLDYYTDYIIAQSWICDTDWPFNNIKIVKGDFTGYRWRFLLQDLEWSLNPNGWTNSGYNHISYMLGYDSGVPYIRFWKDLMTNAYYKKTFINRFADLMNTSYLSENTNRIAQEIYDSSYSEMRAEFVKWGGGESMASSKMSQYSANMTTFISELNNRSNTVRNNIISGFGLTGKYSLELQVQPENTGEIQMNTIVPESYPWTGIYFAGNPVRIEAKNKGNYVFAGWEPNSVIKDVNNPVIDADVKTSGYKFIANFKKQFPEFPVTISEINYSSTAVFPTSDWVELYNYGETDVDLTGWYITDDNASHKWVIPGSYILKANERLVLASSVSKFIVTYPNVRNILGSFGFGLGSLSDSVQLFNSSNKLIAGVKYSSLAPWPTEPLDMGKTLEMKDPFTDLNSPDNWFAGCIGGSPGVGYTLCGPLGISTSPDFFTASIYPNPAVNEINIILQSATDGMKVNCSIYDLLGKEVVSQSFFMQGRDAHTISLANLTPGIYLMQLSDGNTVKTIKFIRQKE